jgi:dihydroneopterin aldolase
MNYTTSLQNIEFYAYHGLYEAEKYIGGKFIVSASVAQNVDDELLITHINQATNYELLYQIIHKHMMHREDLLETVAQKIINEIKHTFNRALHIKVSIEKPRAAGLLPSGTAVVELDLELKNV